MCEEMKTVIPRPVYSLKPPLLHFCSSFSLTCLQNIQESDIAMTHPSLLGVFQKWVIPQGRPRLLPLSSSFGSTYVPISHASDTAINMFLLLKRNETTRSATIRPPLPIEVNPPLPPPSYPPPPSPPPPPPPPPPKRIPCVKTPGFWANKKHQVLCEWIASSFQGAISDVILVRCTPAQISWKLKGNLHLASSRRIYFTLFLSLGSVCSRACTHASHACYLILTTYFVHETGDACSDNDGDFEQLGKTEYPGSDLLLPPYYFNPSGQYESTCNPPNNETRIDIGRHSLRQVQLIQLAIDTHLLADHILCHSSFQLLGLFG